MTKTFYGDLCMGFFGTLYHEFLWDFVDFLKKSQTRKTFFKKSMGFV